ncbi:MAG TPA: hypothetical protein PK828_11045 [Limnochordia bacterium]|nr:hypothetical protein [Bacillota bacterium]HXK98380.1 hypothetical protein [Limnochordia bacterium]
MRARRILAWNIYRGWYPDANFYGTFAEVVERKAAQDSRPFGLTSISMMSCGRPITG